MRFEENQRRYDLYPPIDKSYTADERNEILECWFELMDENDVNIPIYNKWATDKVKNDNFSIDKRYREACRPDEIDLIAEFLDKECQEHPSIEGKMVIKT